MTSGIPQYFNPQTFGFILNCDISSLKNDTEMVDLSMNPKSSTGASYDLCYFLT